ncbi:MAG: DUF368 domain-containing protein [Clostridiales bacterium]|jgi:putative membrane protein|nr:DUF368 domain-containing protein [Clostridiales bacterium]
MASLINIVKGFFIGIALIAPGLSGSMFAVAVGLYEKIIRAISNFGKEFKKSVLFLIPVGIGCLIGILASAKLILIACEKFPSQSYSFFIGLVLGGIPMVAKKMKKISPLYLLVSAAAFAFIVLMTYFGADESAETYVAIEKINSVADVVILLLSGAFSCGMMAFPGVSGAVMLMLTGQYGSVYNSVSSVGDILALAAKGNIADAFAMLPSILVCLPFLAGGLCAFVLVTKPIGWLIENKERLLYYAVFGLMSGAFFALLTGHVLPYLEFAPIPIITAVIFAAVGFFCTVFLDK